MSIANEPAGTWRWDIASGSVDWSAELERIYGLDPGEFGGTVEAFVAFLHPDDRERIWTLVERAIAEVDSFGWEERIVRRDGAERVLLSLGRAVAGPDGRTRELIGICHDVTERIEAQRALGRSERRVLAIIDNAPSIIAVMDLEGRYLMTNQEASRVLGLPREEIVGRPCSELFPKISERLRASDVSAAADMSPVFDDAVLEVDGERRTYACVTFTLPDEYGHPAETCTIATDVTERREREAERRERLHWEQRIGLALAEGRICAFAQPVVRLANGVPAGQELLVRMRSPAPCDELLAPAAFLPAAERYGLIQRIDVWMVAQAIELASTLPCEVNLSALTLGDVEARREIVALLSQAPGVAERLVFEITETAAAEHLDAAAEFASELAGLGCGLALDDFGTGFGSFTYLRRLPLRYLKIDASFVRGVTQSLDDRRVVRSIVGIAEQFGLLTIAEGVEDQATLELLRELGADYAQGFHLGVPAPAVLPVLARGARD